MTDVRPAPPGPAPVAEPPGETPPTDPVPDPLPGRVDPAVDHPLIIIPAWNEEGPLPEVLADLRRVRPASDVVVISDGSTDGTAAVARQGGAAVVELPFNLGIGGALRTGFRYAVRHGYRRAVQFDADGQHDSSQIDRLVDSLDGGADLVIGSRFAAGAATGGTGEAYSVGRVRSGAMGLLRFTVKRITGRRFTDTSSGFRGFSRPMLEYFAGTYPTEYMESVEALLMAHRAGFTVVEVPVRMRERQDGTASNRNLKLLYHFGRLLLTIAASSGRRPGRRPSTPPPPPTAVDEDRRR